MANANAKSGNGGGDTLKTAIAALLTVVFIGLYIYGIWGVWHGSTPNNDKAITLLQPIVYVIVGYYFGRMPSEKVEKQLKDEAKDKGQAADAANAEANRVVSKLQMVRSVLAGVSATDAPRSGFTANLAGVRSAPEETLRVSVAQAISMIDTPTTPSA